MKSWMHPKVRVIVFLSLANAAWITAMWLWVDHSWWMWITPIALSINFLLLTYDQVLTFTRLHSEPLVGHDAWGLLKTVLALSESFQVEPPRLFLVSHPSAQVFCYGKSGRRTRLFVTEGLLKLLNPEELRAVLTFQLVAMNSSFNILNYWLGALIDLFFRVGRGLERAFAFVFGWAPPLAAWFVSPWTWLLHTTLLSPADFAKLDRETATRIDNPEDLARALWKMESYAQTQPWTDAWVFAHMCMVSPLAFRHVLKALHVQPPLKGRIKRLVGRYPL
ncbi:MAG: M48 family metalloprotease [Calothrix sp. SM1_5_4]|nr:M48 family metalloprotease [Calothrix sp. SM1_5_4]